MPSAADPLLLLPQAFYTRDARSVAVDLLGMELHRIINGRHLAVRIVETEAYLGIEDRAAHTFGGRRTPRNASMWGPGGRAYLYFTYGMHHCLNVVTETPERPSAVLIRAGEPIIGIDTMMQLRNVADPRQVASGPAKLCQALDLTCRLDGHNLTTGRVLWLQRPATSTDGGSTSTAAGGRPEAPKIVCGPRVGIPYAGQWKRRLLRFALAGHPHVSKPVPKSRVRPPGNPLQNTQSQVPNP